MTKVQCRWFHLLIYPQIGTMVIVNILRLRQSKNVNKCTWQCCGSTSHHVACVTNSKNRSTSARTRKGKIVKFAVWHRCIYANFGSVNLLSILVAPLPQIISILRTSIILLTNFTLYCQPVNHHWLEYIVVAVSYFLQVAISTINIQFIHY